MLPCPRVVLAFPKKMPSCIYYLPGEWGHLCLCFLVCRDVSRQPLMRQPLLPLLLPFITGSPVHGQWAFFVHAVFAGTEGCSQTRSSRPIPITDLLQQRDSVFFLGSFCFEIILVSGVLQGFGLHLLRTREQGTCPLLCKTTGLQRPLQRKEQSGIDYCRERKTEAQGKTPEVVPMLTTCYGAFGAMSLQWRMLQC